MPKKSALEKIRKYPEKLEKATGEFWEDRKEDLRQFEGEKTSDPEDDILGPAMATASSLARDFMMPEKFSPRDMKGGAAGGGPTKKALKALKKGKKAGKPEVEDVSSMAITRRIQPKDVKKPREPSLGEAEKGTLDYKKIEDEIDKTKKLERLYTEKMKKTYNASKGTTYSGADEKDLEFLEKLKNTIVERKKKLGM